MLPRRVFLKAAGAVSVSPTLAMPSLARGAEQRVLKFVPQADLAVVDPIWTSATVTRNHAFLVFDTLYGQDAQYKAQPQMAAGATTENDGTLWKITLRPGLKFHDDTPVLARDCVASINRWGARDAFGQSLAAATDEVSAPDDKTIQFRLKKPFPLLPDALAKCTAFVPVIMPERLARTDAFTQLKEVVGSGPYRFVAAEHMAGAHTVYERFADYAPCEGGAPQWTSGPKIANFDRVEWLTIPDAATAAASLTSGEVDWWEQPTPDLLPMLRKSNGLAVVNTDPNGNIAILRMNQIVPPFDNPAIRRALLGAVDQRDYMIAGAGTDPSMWQTGVGFFPPGTPLASEAGMQALNGPRDYDKAKREIMAAGYKGEKVVVLVASDIDMARAWGNVCTEMLRKCGMNVDPQTMDWGTVIMRRASKQPPDKGGWNIFFSGWGGIDMMNPIINLSLRGNGANSWFGWPDAPKLEQLRDQWMSAPDLAAQKEIAGEIQQQAFNDVPYIPLGKYYQPVAIKKNIQGLMTGFPIFWNIQRA